MDAGKPLGTKHQRLLPHYLDALFLFDVANFITLIAFMPFCLLSPRHTRGGSKREWQ